MQLDIQDVDTLLHAALTLERGGEEAFPQGVRYLAIREAVAHLAAIRPDLFSVLTPITWNAEARAFELATTQGDRILAVHFFERANDRKALRFVTEHDLVATAAHWRTEDSGTGRAPEVYAWSPASPRFVFVDGDVLQGDTLRVSARKVTFTLDQSVAGGPLGIPMTFAHEIADRALSILYRRQSTGSPLIQTFAQGASVAAREHLAAVDARSPLGHAVEPAANRPRSR